MSEHPQACMLHACGCMHMCILTPCMWAGYMYMPTPCMWVGYMYTYMHVGRDTCGQACIWGVHACGRACIWVCMRGYMCMHVGRHAYGCACMWAGMHMGGLHVHACTCACIWVGLHVHACGWATCASCLTQSVQSVIYCTSKQHVIYCQQYHIT